MPPKLAYDFCCPSVIAVIEKRTCQNCGQYFASQKMKNNHKKSLHKKQTKKRIEASSSDEEEVVELGSPEEEEETTAPIIDFQREWLNQSISH